MSGTIFFFNDTATTEIYTLSLHDALPIYICKPAAASIFASCWNEFVLAPDKASLRSEEHTSELQSLAYLVCRLLLEKKNLARRDCEILNVNNDRYRVRKLATDASYSNSVV